MQLKISAELALAFLFLSVISLTLAVYFLIRLSSSLPSRVKKAGIGFLAFVATIVFMFGVLDYLSTTREACIACHQFNALADNHMNLKCIRCHQNGGVTGWFSFKVRHVRMFLHLRRFIPGEVQAEVSDYKCLDCHQKIKKGVNKKGVIAVRHSDFILKISCIYCHEKEVHPVYSEYQISMKYCLSCHESEDGLNSCKECHRNQPTLQGYLKAMDLIHSADFRSRHGMNTINYCKPCHSTNQVCRNCHPSYPHDTSFKASHGKEALRNILECRQCHLIIRCNDCHGTEMPHNDKWISDHGAKSRVDWGYVCSRCHTFESCKECHNEVFMNKFKKSIEEKEE